MIGKMMTFLAVATAAVTLVAADNAANGSLADARGQIGAIIESPAKMKDVTKSLSPEDQVKFLNEVNAAITEMPGSNEEKAAKFLDVNKAAMMGAAKGNISEMLAEVYATVPPEALTLINERFAAELFNRAADPSVTYTDDQYLKISQVLLEKIASRCAAAGDTGVRVAFAGLMFIRAANGSPADVVAKVTELLPFDVQNMARTEWYKPALGDGEPQTYEPMLDSANAGPQPANDLVIRMAGPQLLEAMLGDVVEWVPVIRSIMTPLQGDTTAKDGTDDGASAATQATDPNIRMGDTGGDPNEDPNAHGGNYNPEPRPYRGQR